MAGGVRYVALSWLGYALHGSLLPGPIEVLIQGRTRGIGSRAQRTGDFKAEHKQDQI